MKPTSDEVLGKIVRNFTITEDLFRQVGAYIDSVILLEDESEFKEKVAEMYIKLASLKTSVNDFIQDLEVYFTEDSDEDESGEINDHI